MKKGFFIFLLMFSGFLLAQSADQKKISDDARSFLELFQKRDYDGILDMTYPVIFEKIDRKMMKDTFRSLLEGNEDFKMEITDADKNAFIASEIFNAKENAKYAFITYPMKMKMIFLKEKLDNEKKEMMVKMMEVQGMKSRFISDDTLEMSKESMIIALNDKSTGNTWKYLNYDEANPLYVSVVPVDVLKKAKEYYAEFLIKQKENAN